MAALKVRAPPDRKALGAAAFFLLKLVPRRKPVWGTRNLKPHGDPAKQTDSYAAAKTADTQSKARTLTALDILNGSL
jgi:hypothetical protein